MKTKRSSSNPNKDSSNKKLKKIKKVRVENLPISNNSLSKIDFIAKKLSQKIDKELFSKRYATPSAILKLVGAGAFLAASVAFPTLPYALKPFLTKKDERFVWKRFNIPYLQRTLKRLQRQKMVTIVDNGKYQIVEVTNQGKRRILKYALQEISIDKPKYWDHKWRLVSYDIPHGLASLRRTFRDFLTSWGFYQLHESVFLHAYPCFGEIEFLREYLGLSEYIRILEVTRIENDKPFREFFGV